MATEGLCILTHFCPAFPASSDKFFCRIANEFCKVWKISSLRPFAMIREGGRWDYFLLHSPMDCFKLTRRALLFCSDAASPSCLPRLCPAGPPQEKNCPSNRRYAARPPSSFFLPAMILFLWRKEGGRDRLKWSRNADMGWAYASVWPSLPVSPI